MINIHDKILYPLSFDEFCGMIKNAGFDGFVHAWRGADNPFDIAEAAKYAKQYGLVLENVHAPYPHDKINSLWLDNADGTRLEDMFTACVRECGEHGVPAMVMHLSGDEPPPYNAFGLDRVKRIVAEAERSGVSIAFENLFTTRHLEYVLCNINSPRAGFCYDTGHHNYKTPDEDFFGKYGQRLTALHLHDNDSTDDQHKLPFDGTVNWRAVARNIKNSGYKGAVMLEVHNTYYRHMPPERFIQTAYERAKRLWGMLNED